MRTSIDYERIVKGWSEADKKCAFNFTSGHIGAIPCDDTTILQLLGTSGLKFFFNILILFANELIKAIFLTVFPIKSLLLYSRTLARNIFNDNRNNKNKLIILSLGNQPKDKDPYFGPLIDIIEEPLTYIKIVGGNVYKSKDYLFLESYLTKRYLFKLFLFTLLIHPYSFLYLIRSSRCISNINEKFVYILLGMKELNVGVIFNNHVITQSLYSIVKYVGKARLIYPLEGRNWEKNIVRVMNKLNIVSIGYLHCALTPRHFSLTRLGFYKDHHLPSVIVANSEMSAKILKQNFPNTIIRNGFFLRGSKKYTNPIKKDPKTLLFALTGNVEESFKILNYLSVSKIQENYNIVIRLNPNTSSYAVLSGLAKKLRFNLYNGKEDVLPSICFFRSSSVALDYLSLNVLPVYISINEITSNNIFEIDNKYQANCLILKENSVIDLNLTETIGKMLDNNLDNLLNGFEISNYYLRNYQSSESLSCLID